MEHFLNNPCHNSINFPLLSSGDSVGSITTVAKIDKEKMRWSPCLPAVSIGHGGHLQFTCCFSSLPRNNVEITRYSGTSRLNAQYQPVQLPTVARRVGYPVRLGAEPLTVCSLVFFFFSLGCSEFRKLERWGNFVRGGRSKNSSNPACLACRT
jgi:hypothetical protein